MQDNNPPETTIPNTTKFTCSASCHMRAMTFAVYDVCRSVSAKSGKMYCSAEFIAERYIGLSQRTVYRHLDLLEAQGWLILTRESEWLANGKKSTRHFRVLTHEAWAQAHPGKCEPPVKKKKSPPYDKLSNGAQPYDKLSYTIGQIGSDHMTESLNNLKERNLKEQTLKDTSGIPKPYDNLSYGGNELGQQQGTPSHMNPQPCDTESYGEVDALQDRFTRLRRKKETPAVTAPTGPTPARRLALRLTGTLGIGSPTALQGWESVIGRLLAQHPFADVEQAAIYVAVHQARFMRLPDGPDSGAQGFETHFPTVLKKAREMQSAERTVA